MPEKTTAFTKAEESAQNKRNAIVLAARDIFARQGYEATTIAEIATAARVAVGTVYLYFHNKREIYVATSLSWVEEIAIALLKPEIFALPIEQVPRAMIETVFQLCHVNNKFMSLFQVDLQTPNEIEVRRKGEEQLVQVIETFLLRCIERGDFPPFNTHMYSKVFFSLVHSVLYNCFCLEDGENEESYRESTIEIIERLFFGPSLRG